MAKVLELICTIGIPGIQSYQASLRFAHIVHFAIIVLFEISCFFLSEAQLLLDVVPHLFLSIFPIFLFIRTPNPAVLPLCASIPRGFLEQPFDGWAQN